MKLKADRTNYKMWKEKHQQEEKKLARSLSSKMAPNTYTPIVAGTFESLVADKSRVRRYICSLSLDGAMVQSKSEKDWGLSIKIQVQINTTR